LTGRRDMEELVAARELALGRRIELMEVDLAALRMHRELVTAQLAKALRHSWSPEVKGVLTGLALAVATVMFLLTVIAIL